MFEATNNKNENLILEGNIFSGLIKLSVPLMLLSIINTAYTLVDTYFVGRIDELAVGAVSLVAPIVGCGNACIAGLCAATVALVSRALGEGNEKESNRIAKHILVIGSVLGIIIGFITLLCREYILNWLETPDEIYDMTMSYLVGISFDFLFAFIISFFMSVKQSSGDTKIGVILNIISCLFNCILDPVFISVFKLGTLGAALATLLSKLLVCPIALILLFKKDQIVHIEGSLFDLDFALTTKVIKVSFPAAIGQFLASFGFVIMSKEIVSYGAIIISAYGIGNQISSLFYIPLNGIGSALTTYIGQNLGNKNIERAKECFKKAMLLTAFTAAIFTILGFYLSPYAIHLFIKNASELLVYEALVYAYYSIFTSFCMGWFANLLAVFNGSSNTLISMILSSCRLFAVRIPIIYLFNTFTDLGHIGIWVAMIISNLIICISGQILYFVYPWSR